MKVLVLGGSGFLGRHVVAALQDRGHAPVVGTRDPRRLRSLPPTIATCERRRVRFEQMGRPGDWDTTLTDIDAVVNCVGILRPRGRATYDRVHRRADVLLANPEGPVLRRVVLLFVFQVALAARNERRAAAFALPRMRQAREALGQRATPLMAPSPGALALLWGAHLASVLRRGADGGAPLTRHRRSCHPVDPAARERRAFRCRHFLSAKVQREHGGGRVEPPPTGF